MWLSTNVENRVAEVSSDFSFLTVIEVHVVPAVMGCGRNRRLVATIKIPIYIYSACPVYILLLLETILIFFMDIVKMRRYKAHNESFNWILKGNMMQCTALSTS